MRDGIGRQAARLLLAIGLLGTLAGCVVYPAGGGTGTRIPAASTGGDGGCGSAPAERPANGGRRGGAVGAYS